jgi:hypothetical protein
MSGFLPSWFFEQFRAANGLPLAGGSITTYIDGTSTPKALYFDITLENPCPNPLQLDSAGFAPQYFLGEGLYTFVIKDNSGATIATRNKVSGAVSSLNTSAFQIKIDENDNDPNYLYDKLQDSSTIVWDKTADKIIANVAGNAIDSFKVKAVSADNIPGYIADKIGNTSTISLSVSSDKLYAEYTGRNIVQISSGDNAPGYLADKLIDSDTIVWEISDNTLQGNVNDLGKVLISSGDILGYVEDKIRPGAGIVFTETEDINGKQLHISTTNSTTNLGKVKVTSGDTLAFLSDKIVGGPGIIVSNDSNNITISNVAAGNSYISSAIEFAQAVNISASGEFSLFTLNLTPGVWDVGGNVCTTSAENMLCNFNTFEGIIFDGKEHWVFNSSSNPLGTLCAPLVERRITVINTLPYYLVVQVLLSSSSAPVWGSVYAKQVA